MELSDLDSNKHNAIIQFRQTISESIKSKASRERLAVEPRKVNEQNEMVACALKQKQRRLTKEEVSTLISAYNNGKTTCELAEIYGCDRHAISRHLKKNGIQVTIVSTKVAENIPQVVTLYNSGMKIIEIAKQYGFYLMDVAN